MCGKASSQRVASAGELRHTQPIPQRRRPKRVTWQSAKDSSGTFSHGEMCTDYLEGSTLLDVAKCGLRECKLAEFRASAISSWFSLNQSAESRVFASRNNPTVTLNGKSRHRVYQFGTNLRACPPTGHALFGLDRVLCNAKISGGLERRGQGYSGREWTIYCIRSGCGRLWKIYVENQRQPG